MRRFASSGWRRYALAFVVVGASLGVMGAQCAPTKEPVKEPAPTNPPPPEQPHGSATFTFLNLAPGLDQRFTVPDGVTSITIDAFGAEGGAGQDGAYGGAGGKASATIVVTPGEVLHVNVGGRPGAGNPASGGYSVGGGTTGGPGDGGYCYFPVAPGEGGTQSGGGAGGTGTPFGTGGVEGSGGASGDITTNTIGATSHTGGGGGGGFFGGGGGGGARDGRLGGGAGGGGSGFTPSGTGMTNGVGFGNGQVTITW
jgi:hypothetical protein